MKLHATDQAEAAPSADLEKIVNDFAALKRDFADLIGHVKGGAVNGASGALRGSIGAFSEKTQSVYDELAAQGDRSAKAIARQVEERPIASLLIAFAAGFVASKLLTR